jgi:transcription antitermination factor NusA-like protein
MEDVDVFAMIPKTCNAVPIMKYVFSKDAQAIKAFEIDHECTIIKSAEKIEISSKSRETLQSGVQAVKDYIKLLVKTLYFDIIDIPVSQHGFLIGKKGQNITKLKLNPIFSGRFVDVIVSNSEEINIDKKEPVYIVIKRDLEITDLIKSNEEASKFMIKTIEFIKSDLNNLSNMKVMKVKIDSKLRSRLIGVGGHCLKELLDIFNGSVTINFGDDLCEIFSIKGPSADVMKASDLFEKKVKDLERVDKLSMFEISVVLPSLQGKKIFGINGKSSGWIVNKLKVLFKDGKLKLNANELKEFKSDLENNQYVHLNLSYELNELPLNDTILIRGPKPFVLASKLLIEEKSKLIFDSINILFNIFDECPQIDLETMDEIGGNVKENLLSRVIGKEGKNIKMLVNDNNVTLTFLKENENGYVIGSVRIEGIEVDVNQAKESLLKCLHDNVTFLN